MKLSSDQKTFLQQNRQNKQKLTEVLFKKIKDFTYEVNKKKSQEI